MPPSNLTTDQSNALYAPMPPVIPASTMAYPFTAATFTVPLRSVPLPPQSNGRARARATCPDYRRASSQTSALTQDFHLDIFFSPVWMSGPNVFSFNKDGTVVSPKTCPSEPYPGYYAHKPSLHNNGIVPNPIAIKPLAPAANDTTRHNSTANSTAPRSYADAAKSPISNGSSLEEKPLTNVAITEEDEAAFEASQSKGWVTGLKETRAAEKAELVYTWPPVSYSQLQPEEGFQAPGNHFTDENEAPQLSYASSADTSGSDFDEAFLILPPEQRGDRVPFKALERPVAPLAEEPLEKVVGFGRLRRRAPPPLTIRTEDLEWDESRCFLLSTDALAIAANTGGFLSPLTAIPTVISQLSARLPVA